MGLHNEVIKFALAGVLVIGTDVGIYSLLIHFLPYAVAKGTSFTCGGAVAYLVNKYWTFRQEQRSSAEVARFIAAYFSALGLNVATNELLLRASAGAVFFALAVATAVTSVFTFFVFKYWVFQKR